MGFDGVDSNGFALFWHETIHVDIQALSDRFIGAYVRVSDVDPTWHPTCIYGEHRVENWHLMWAKVKDLKP